MNLIQRSLGYDTKPKLSEIIDFDPASVGNDVPNIGLPLNHIYNMDCLKAMRLIDSESVDMIFVDLPYQKTQNSWDMLIPLGAMWQAFERIITDTGIIVLFAQDKFTAKLMLSNEKLHRYNLIWDKIFPTGFLNAKKQPMRSHEDICVFYKNPGTYNPQMTKGQNCHTRGTAVGKRSDKSSNQFNYGAFDCVETEGDLKYPKSILTFQKPHPSTTIHPTQKPLELCRYLVRTYTNPGDIILDCCCGAGTIPLAAKLEGRNYIGVDNGVCEKKDSEYSGKSWAQIATERIMAYRE